MRSFTDDEGRVAWIFDETTHPRGNLFKKPEIIIKKPIVLIEEKHFDPIDTNKDGKISLKERLLAKIKK